MHTYRDGSICIEAVDSQTDNQCSIPMTDLCSRLMNSFTFDILRFVNFDYIRVFTFHRLSLIIVLTFSDA